MKQKFRKTLIVAALAVSAFGISFAQEVEPQPLDIADPVAYVQGEPLSKAEFMHFITFLTNGNEEMIQSSEQVESLVEAYVLQKALAKKAQEEKLDQNPAFENQMAQIRTSALAEQFISFYSTNLDISDKELKQEYDRQVASVDKKEYKAAHILVETKEDADKVLKLLADKQEFAKVAEEYSQDPGSASNGGDLGWFSGSMMVSEFSDAIKNMKKGEVSKTPVKSQFGYHIISLEDTRPVAVESFDNLKDNLKSILVEQKLREYIDQLSADLNIDYQTKDSDKK